MEAATTEAPLKNHPYADAVVRLRISKEKEEELVKEIGERHGYVWARTKAEYSEVKALADAVEQHGQDHLLASDGTSNTAAERLFFIIREEEEGDHEAAGKFWPDETGIKNPRTVAHPAFAAGFLEGAMKIWDAVKDEL